MSGDPLSAFLNVENRRESLGCLRGMAPKLSILSAAQFRSLLIFSLMMTAVLFARLEFFLCNYAVIIGVKSFEYFRIAFPLIAGDLAILVGVHLLEGVFAALASGLSELFA